MDNAAIFRQGKSLLNEALSPSSKQLLQDFFDATDDGPDQDEPPPTSSSRGPHETHNYNATTSIAQGNDQKTSGPHHRGGTAPSLRSMVSTTVFAQLSHNSKSIVQLRVEQRPFCLQLSVNTRREIVVAGFTPDPSNGGAKGTIEASGQVQIGDVLVAVNDEMEALISVEATARIMMAAELPAVLTFRRVPVVRSTLGEYTREEIARNLQLHDSRLATRYGIDDAAALVKACIDLLDDRRALTPLLHYVHRLEDFLCWSPEDGDSIRRREELVAWMDKVHHYVEEKKKEQVKKWTSTKAANFKRIEVLGKQRENIRKKLDKMRATPALLHPGNHMIWQEFIELRHLSSQLLQSIERGKQHHYLPEFEEHALRFGSDGIYVGVGDLWISSLQAKFTLETRTSAPHVMFHLSTPSTTGLKLRATNVKLSTEGRLPSFSCDELNIEAQLVANVPFNFDEISGWSVPQEDLHVEFTSFSYYERKATSVKRGADHDTVIKLFMNRLLPTVVRQAAQGLFCLELGPLIESRNAQLSMSGELSIQGRPLELYDVPLNTSRTGATAASSAEEQDLREEARLLMALSEDESDALCRVLKSVETSFKKRGFVSAEHSSLSIRVLTHYFDQFKRFPNMKVLITELWNQSMQLITDSFDSDALSFDMVVNNLELLQQYPVDVSISISDLTFRLDLCEAAAVYYTTLQRIIRHKMDSVSIGISNMDAMKDGSYLENELASLDTWYDKTNRVLSHMTINVDDLGVVIRGGMPAGFSSSIALEAHDLLCKGPCAGTFTIPLTDMSSLRLPDRSEGDSIAALMHERNALVFSKFFLSSRDDEGNQAEDVEVDANGYIKSLPGERVAVSVRNTTARVVFEVPKDAVPGSTYMPFAFSLETSDGPPKLIVETSEFAKCQYKAQLVKISGSVWRLLKRTRDATEEAIGNGDATSASATPQARKSSSSIWTDYLESPFFTAKFQFFTSCQVTREHIFWSIKSAALNPPSVARIRHRVCVVELLQDIGMISLVDGARNSKMKAGHRRHHDARFRRALYRRGASAAEDDDGLYDPRQSILSHRDTPLVRKGSFAETADDSERLSVSNVSKDDVEGDGDSQCDDANEHHVQNNHHHHHVKASQPSQRSNGVAGTPGPTTADTRPSPMQTQSSVFF